MPGNIASSAFCPGTGGAAGGAQGGLGGASPCGVTGGNGQPGLGGAGGGPTGAAIGGGGGWRRRSRRRWRRGIRHTVAVSNKFDVFDIHIEPSGIARFTVKVAAGGLVNVLETAWLDNFAAAERSSGLLRPARGRFVFARASRRTNAAGTVRSPSSRTFAARGWSPTIASRSGSGSGSPSNRPVASAADSVSTACS